MIAVGAGIAPMIQALHELLNSTNDTTKIVLLYGTRTVNDILLRELLEDWEDRHSDRFKVVYCVGSRWAGVHFGAKTENEYIPPEIPDGFDELAKSRSTELGWVNKDKILKFGFPPCEDTKVFVCGLPGVYLKLCGPRTEDDLPLDSALHQLGYSKDMVVKF